MNRSEKINKVLWAILIVFMTTALIIYVGIALINLNLQNINYCDNKFGVDGWYLNETTGTGDYKYYIGQVWECVPNADNTSKKIGERNETN